MARLRRLAALALSAPLALAPWARGQEALPPGFHDRPVLVVDPGRHTAPIIRTDADAAGRLAATASLDKTVRLWSVADGALLRTIRLPTGLGNVGQARAVALDPAGALVAAGGWTSPEPPNPVFLYDTATGALLHRIPGLPQVVHHLAFSRDGRYLAAALGGGARRRPRLARLRPGARLGGGDARRRLRRRTELRRRLRPRRRPRHHEP